MGWVGACLLMVIAWATASNVGRYSVVLVLKSTSAKSRNCTCWGANVFFRFFRAKMLASTVPSLKAKPNVVRMPLLLWPVTPCIEGWVATYISGVALGSTVRAGFVM